MTDVPFSNVTSTSLSSVSFKRLRPLALSGAGFFWTTFFWAGLTAWGLPGIGFLATGLLGIAKKTSAPERERLQDRIKGSRKGKSRAPILLARRPLVLRRMTGISEIRREPLPAQQEAVMGGITEHSDRENILER